MLSNDPSCYPIAGTVEYSVYSAPNAATCDAPHVTTAPTYIDDGSSKCVPPFLPSFVVVFPSLVFYFISCDVTSTSLYYFNAIILFTHLSCVVSTDLQ
jgi:hypothetical protein